MRRLQKNARCRQINMQRVSALGADCSVFACKNLENRYLKPDWYVTFTRGNKTTRERVFRPPW